MSKKKIVKNRIAVIDSDSALKFFKRQNGGGISISKSILSDLTGVSMATRKNWQNTGSKMLGYILTLHEETGYPLEQIIKEIIHENETR